MKVSWEIIPHILRKIKKCVKPPSQYRKTVDTWVYRLGLWWLDSAFELWIFTSFSWMKPGDIQGFSPTVPFNHLWRCLIFLGNLALVKIFKMALDWSTHAYQETNALTVLPTSLGDELRCCWIHVPSAMVEQWSVSWPLWIFDKHPSTIHRQNQFQFSSSSVGTGDSWTQPNVCLACLAVDTMICLEKEHWLWRGKCPKITGLCVKTHSSLTKSHGTIQQESQQQPSETLKLNIGKSTQTYRSRVVSCSYESRQEAAMHWNSLWDRNRQAKLQANTPTIRAAMSCTDQIRVIIHWR